MRRHLSEHTVSTDYEEGWSDLPNGDLLEVAEAAGYQLFVTTVQEIRYQQNLGERNIAILVLMSTSWPRIRERVDDVVEVINAMKVGSYAEISV